jgi:leucyl aminopeptidase
MTHYGEYMKIILTDLDLGASANGIFCKKGETLFGKELTKSIPGLESTLKSIKDREQKSLEVHRDIAEYLILELDASKGLDEQEHFRTTSSKLVKAAVERKQETFTLVATGANITEISSIIDGIYLADYSYDRYKSKATPSSLNEVTIRVSADVLAEARALATAKEITFSGIYLTRDLINTPGGDLTPEIYVDIIEDTFKGQKNVALKVRDEKQLKEEGFMGLITVGRGGQNPPRMVTLSYTPEKTTTDTHLGLVGKGVTFDTGGISLKPGGSMWEMRMDMGGSATVIGAFKTIVELGLPIKVTAVVCLTENRPGENACLPGDIFTAKNGKTVMVDNTDAEGRLVLSDGLCEVCDLGATHVVDLATLTGAIIRAIGMSITGLFTNSDELGQNLIESGKPAGEKLWNMPMDMEYRAALDDKVADLCNIGGEAGATTAALFLQEFVTDSVKWAHLDIAGTAFNSKGWKYYGWGATGWGVQTLVNLAQKI